MNDNERDALLARIDERTAHLRNDFNEMKNLILSSYATKAEVDVLRNDHVSMADFAPVKRIVYGATATILTGFLGSLVYLVLKLQP